MFLNFFHHFVTNCLDCSVTELTVFCDSSEGQNKYATVICMCHHFVHTKKLRKEIKMAFSIRGHSYLECHKNTGLINKKFRVELPEDWYDVFRTARQKPKPFSVIKVDQNMVRAWTDHFNHCNESNKLSFPTRPIRELKVTENHTVLVSYRDSYSGHWLEAPILPPPKEQMSRSTGQNKQLPEGKKHQKN